MQQNDTPYPTWAAIEARLIVLLEGGGPNNAKAYLAPVLARMNRHNLRPVLRIKILLFIGSGLCACLAERLTTERLSELLKDEMNNRLSDTEEGRMIDRHRHLLLSLVLRGCELRGEIPTFRREDAANANA